MRQRTGTEHSGVKWSSSTKDSETAWRVSSGADSLKCNTGWSVMYNERPENPDHSSLLWCNGWCIPVLYSEGHSFPLRWLQRNTSCIVYLVESTNDMHWFLIHSLLNLALYLWMQAKWAQLQQAMPPCDSTAEQDDEGFKLEGKSNQRATYCLFVNSKTKTENDSCCDWQWLTWDYRLD